MKKLFLLSIILFAFYISVFSQIENVAKEILTAYKNKDAELLKKNASGMLIMTISPAYFSDPSLKEDIISVENWNGEIKEIRYQVSDMMGKKIFMATAHYADIPGKTDIYAVLLSSTDGKKWIMFASGLGKLSKTEFDELSKEIPVPVAKTENKPAKVYSIEMANGDIFDKVSMEKMIECFNTLDEDNFFITMTCNDDFIQAAVSEKGFVVEYSEKGVRYVATDVVLKEQTINLFKKYYQDSDDWKNGVSWKKD
jgi:hypothetical protein